MKKVDFTKDFYEKVYKAVYEYCEEYYKSDCDGSMSVSTVEVDGYEIECDADIDTEWHDDSFDHAFGTWHDPYACYEFADVAGISNVTVWDEEGDEVEGFSVDDYDAQFIEDEYNGIKKGDKVVVLYRGGYTEPYEVEYYNKRTGRYRVRAERQFHNGKKYYQTKDVSRLDLKRAA